MQRIAGCLLAIGLVTGCTNELATRTTLESLGYTDIETHGYGFNCARDDDTCTAFTAKSERGRTVRGSVGCGYFFKGCTVRF